LSSSDYPLQRAPVTIPRLSTRQAMLTALFFALLTLLLPASHFASAPPSFSSSVSTSGATLRPRPSENSRMYHQSGFSILSRSPNTISPSSVPASPGHSADSSPRALSFSSSPFYQLLSPRDMDRADGIVSELIHPLMKRSSSSYSELLPRTSMSDLDLRGKSSFEQKEAATEKAKIDIAEAKKDCVFLEDLGDFLDDSYPEDS
jgi:hypothetical protein